MDTNYQEPQIEKNLDKEPHLEVGSNLPQVKPAPNFIVPLAGLFLAIIFLSGAEFGLNNLEVKRLTGDWQLDNPAKNLSLVLNSTINDRASDVALGVKTINSFIYSGLDKLSIRATKGIETVRLSADLGVETASNIERGVLSASVSGAKGFTDSVSGGALIVAENVGQTSEDIAFYGLANISQLRESTYILVYNVQDWLSNVSDQISYYAGSVVDRWKIFITGRGEEVKQVQVEIDEVALREEIKQQILAELGDEIRSALSSGSTEPQLIENSGGQGVVVVPQDGERSQEQIRKKIQALFSDQVNVQFDETGQSGVVRPVFRNITGENYVFVLTPIGGN